MRSSAAILENDVGNIDSVEQKALELIRRFNDPNREHVLQGVFKETDGYAEIRAKQRRVETKIRRLSTARVAGRRQLMLFMVIEHFKNRAAKAVYRRFRDEGRLMPEGLATVDSWVATDFERCFQLVECEDPALLQVWAQAWEDLIAFEFHPVVPSKQAFETLEPHL